MQAHPLSSPAARKIQSTTPLSPIDPTRLAEGAGLAHDAGNLLGALGLYCDLLSVPGVLRPEHRHYVHELQQLSRRSGTLIRRLLGEGEPFPLPSRQRSVRPAETLTRLAPLLQSIAGPHAALTVEISDGLPALPFPPEIFERILVNLVRNASEALRDRAQREFQARPGLPPTILVRLASGGRGLRLTVEDNGPGMPMPVAAAFLKPRFLPVQAARGLGHRIVSELLHATSGVLEINVAPGRRTTLCMDWDIGAPEKERPC